MLVENGLFGNVDKVAYAIKQIQIHAPKEGYYVAFSGGKDSCVVLDLVKKSGVKYDAHHNITNVEPPELVYFIHEHHPDVIEEMPNKTMWQLIKENRTPPTRLMRYCCRELKEHGGDGRFKITGVRQEESVKRSGRKLVEPCMNNTGTRILNPIIEWTEEEVWEYIKTRNIPYCKLYDEGWSRIGCLMCPMGGSQKMLHDSKLYPKLTNQFIRVFDAVVKQRKKENMKCTWNNGKEMFDWWIGNDEKEPEGQQALFV